MQRVKGQAAVRRCSYRPEQRVCPECHQVLRRSHILWRKHLLTLDGSVRVTSWGYRCPQADCGQAGTVYRSQEAEGLHLKKKQFGRDVIVQVGYRRFWYHQTMYEIHDWLTQDLKLRVVESQVLSLIGDFLALLRAAQPAKVRTRLAGLTGWVVGLDGMQPEKGNTCLYVVRELQRDVTLLAEDLADSSEATIRTRLLQPLKALAEELELSWQGIVSDAQESIRTAVAKDLPGVPHQACQSHGLREAGGVTFATDRALKKQLKARLRNRLKRVERDIAQLPEETPYRGVLVDYGAALHSTLLEGGVAPFELGGIHVFEDLTAVAGSLARCQEKGGTRCYGDCSA